MIGAPTRSGRTGRAAHSASSATAMAASDDPASPDEPADPQAAAVGQQRCPQLERGPGPGRPAGRRADPAGPPVAAGRAGRRRDDGGSDVHQATAPGPAGRGAGATGGSATRTGPPATRRPPTGRTRWRRSSARTCRGPRRTGRRPPARRTCRRRHRPPLAAASFCCSAFRSSGDRPVVIDYPVGDGDRARAVHDRRGQWDRLVDPVAGLEDHAVGVRQELRSSEHQPPNERLGPAQDVDLGEERVQVGQHCRAAGP